MIRRALAWALPAVLALEVSAHAAPLEVEVLLNRAGADKAGIGALKSELEITPSRGALVEDQSGVYLVAWGGAKAIEGLPSLDGFAFTPDGLLLAVRGTDLVYLDAAGAMRKLCSLPSPGMGIAAGIRERMFLFDRSPSGAAGLYELLKHGKARKLLESPEPIRTVAEAPDGRILFAAGKAVYAVAPGRKMELVAALPDRERVESVAVDPKSGRVYLSDGRGVFAVKARKAALVTREAGGTLRWYDGGLLVFDPQKALLLRVLGLETAAFSKSSTLAQVPASSIAAQFTGARYFAGLAEKARSDSESAALVQAAQDALLGVPVGLAVPPATPLAPITDADAARLRLVREEYFKASERAQKAVAELSGLEERRALAAGVLAKAEGEGRLVDEAKALLARQEELLRESRAKSASAEKKLRAASRSALVFMAVKDPYWRGLAEAYDCMPENAAASCPEQESGCVEKYGAGHAAGRRIQEGRRGDASRRGQEAKRSGRPLSAFANPQAAGACGARWVEAYNAGYFGDAPR